MDDGNLDYRRLESLEAIVQGSTDNPDSRASELKRENRKLLAENDRLRKQRDDSTDALLELMGLLPPLESRIVEYLWHRGRVRLDDLIGPTKPWSDEILPSSQEKVIRRLADRLEFDLKRRERIHYRNNIVWLSRPDK